MKSQMESWQDIQEYVKNNKKKLSQMAHTISEVKTMTCIKCKGERIVWTKDKYGHAKAKPCPVCNREGNEIRHEMKELGKC